jgi:hypothetical protein
MCHGNGKTQSFARPSNTRDKKTFITYNPKHGISYMKKHMEIERVANLVRYKLELVVTKRSGDGCQKAKKHNIIPLLTIIAFFHFQKT